MFALSNGYKYVFNTCILFEKWKILSGPHFIFDNLIISCLNSKNNTSVALLANNGYAKQINVIDFTL